MISIRLLLRDLRSGELSILLASLLLATAAITSVSLFTSRIENAIYDRASELIAADARVVGTIPIKEEWRVQAHALGLEHAESLGFRAMAFAGEKMQLVAAKAVSKAYPLKGNLIVATRPFAAGEVSQTGPPSGEIWLTSRLFNALGIEVGDTLQLGSATFIASRALIKEPDNAQSIFGVAPRALLNKDDVDKTGAVRLGSRVNYSLMLTGETSDLERFKNWLEPQRGNHHRWISVEEGNRGVSQALMRAEQFLLLAGSLSVILCSIAIALAARRYAKRHTAQVALLKTFGRTPNQITYFYALQLITLGLGAVLIGSFLGWGLHWLLLEIFNDLLPTDLAPPAIKAYWSGALSCLVALSAFAGPPLFNLRFISPAQVLRESSDPRGQALWSLAIGTIALGLLVFWFSMDIAITLILFAGLSACILGVGLLAFTLVRTSHRLSQFSRGAWRIGLANLYRHRHFNTLQILIFSVALCLLVSLILVRTSLIHQWQNQLPEDAPNHFIFNVFPDEKDALKNLFEQSGVDYQDFYPMVRGRILSINQQPLEERIPDNPRMNYERELNLTWSKTMGKDNALVAGNWWNDQVDKNKASEKIFVSAEEEYAQGLGIHVGDTLRFSVAGSELDAEVASIRAVKWDSMNPNFFMIFDRQLLDGSMANWLTSFHLPEDKKLFLNYVSEQHASISLVEIDQMINQVQGIVNQVSLAVEFILVLILIAGGLVLIASVQATLDARFKESAIMRALGAPRHLISKVLLIEFASLGLLSGFIASAGAQVGLYLLQSRVFELDYQLHTRALLITPVFACLLIGCLGWYATRSVTHVTPLSILRKA